MPPPPRCVDSEHDLWFDGLSAPPAGEEAQPRVSPTQLAAGSQIAGLVGALGNSITNQEYKENKDKEKNMR